jgi:hypothetical protein
MLWAQMNRGGIATRINLAQSNQMDIRVVSLHFSPHASKQSRRCRETLAVQTQGSFPFAQVSGVANKYS